MHAKTRDIAHLHARAAAARAADAQLRAAANARDASRPETYTTWLAAGVAWRAALAAAYPTGFWGAVGNRYERLSRSDPDAIEMAMAFLEADPWFFRSGYVKAAILRRLTRLSLTPRAVARLNRVVLAAVDGRDRREFRRYCRLAAAVATPRVSAALQERLASSDAGVRRRAEWMLATIERRPAR